MDGKRTGGWPTRNGLKLIRVPHSRFLRVGLFLGLLNLHIHPVAERRSCGTIAGGQTRRFLFICVRIAYPWRVAHPLRLLEGAFSVAGYQAGGPPLSAQRGCRTLCDFQRVRLRLQVLLGAPERFEHMRNRLRKV
jgi:hypothetical protein